MEKMIEQWCQEYDEAHENLKQVAYELETIFKENFDGKNVLIGARVKSPQSLRDKIKRKGYYYKPKYIGKSLFDFLSDAVGIRLVCLEKNDEAKVYKIILGLIEEFKKSGIEFKDKIRSQPELQMNSHEIYRIDGVFKDIQFELQIKSAVHLLWGEIEHFLFYKNPGSLIGENHYKEQLDYLYSDLKNVDGKLSSIKRHIGETTPVKELNEVKDISKSIMNSMIGPSISLDKYYSINVKTLYSIISDMFFDEFREVYLARDVVKRGFSFTKADYYKKLNTMLGVIVSKESFLNDCKWGEITIDENSLKTIDAESINGRIAFALMNAAKTNFGISCMMNLRRIIIDGTVIVDSQIIAEYVKDLYPIDEVVMGIFEDYGENESEDIESVAKLADDILNAHINRICVAFEEDRGVHYLGVVFSIKYCKVIEAILRRTVDKAQMAIMETEDRYEKFVELVDNIAHDVSMFGKTAVSNIADINSFVKREYNAEIFEVEEMKGKTLSYNTICKIQEGGALDA